MARLILSAARVVLSISALWLLGAASANAQEAGPSLALGGVPATLTIPGSFTLTLSGSTGDTSNAALYPIYGPAPCAATVEAQLQASPEEVLVSPGADELPAFGLDGPFTVRAQGIGQVVSSPGVYTVCVFMEAAAESEVGEPSEEEEGLVATASATFTVLPALTGAPPPSVAPRAVRRCLVPRLRGKRLASAEKAIRRAHCKVGRIRRIRSRHVRRGHVIWQSRRAGGSLPAGAKVRLLVSRG